MKNAGPARLSVWLVAIFVGAFGWWLGSGVMSRLAEWPRASFGQALGLQISFQLIVHMMFVGLGALTEQSD